MHLPDLWDRVLLAVQTAVGAQDVDIWLKRATPIDARPEPGRTVDGGESSVTLVLEVPNRYYADWIRENYQAELERALLREDGRAYRVELVAAEDAVTSEVPRTDGALVAEEPSRAVGVMTAKHFGNFVVGECNKFAHAAARAVSDHPAEQYNPLFIYGATGLGKTHLMHAIANQILGRAPEARIVYVTAEDFMNEMIDCLRFKRMDDFRAKYRKRATVLLVDDIQTLSGKDRTQEEFFHTFDALQSSGRQIVLSSDVVPKDIDKLEPRLRTRFEGGLLADMQPPDRETLQAILIQKAEQLGLSLPIDLATEIANGASGSVRELEGKLSRLQAMARLNDEPLSLGAARRRLPDLFTTPMTQPDLAPSTIIAAVARFFGLRSADLTGTRRTRKLTVPRHIAMYLSRKYTRHSLEDLGREFGRDHTTVLHGFQKTAKDLAEDPNLEHQVRLIGQSLGLKMP
jgi:chromosomal replication initiator protein